MRARSLSRAKTGCKNSSGNSRANQWGSISTPQASPPLSPPHPLPSSHPLPSPLSPLRLSRVATQHPRTSSGDSRANQSGSISTPQASPPLSPPHPLPSSHPLPSPLSPLRLSRVATQHPRTSSGDSRANQSLSINLDTSGTPSSNLIGLALCHPQPCRLSLTPPRPPTPVTVIPSESTDTSTSTPLSSFPSF